MNRKKIISLSVIIICLLLLNVVSLWMKDTKADARCVPLELSWGSTVRVDVSHQEGGDFPCPAESVVTGVSYKERGDEHINEIFCTTVTLKS